MQSYFSASGFILNFGILSIGSIHSVKMTALFLEISCTKAVLTVSKKIHIRFLKKVIFARQTRKAKRRCKIFLLHIFIYLIIYFYHSLKIMKRLKNIRKCYNFDEWAKLTLIVCPSNKIQNVAKCHYFSERTIIAKLLAIIKNVK